MTEVEAKVFFYTQTDRLLEEKVETVETFYNIVGKVEAQVLVNKCTPSIALVRVKTLADKLTEV